MTTRSNMMLLGLCLGALALAGCAMGRGSVPSDESQLVAAGFRAQAADTPKRQKALEAMPPLQMLRHTPKSGKVFYTFADPYNCKCLYTGNQKNYQEYRRLAAEQNRAVQDSREAPPNAETDWWDPSTGLWGPILGAPDL